MTVRVFQGINQSGNDVIVGIANNGVVLGLTFDAATSTSIRQLEERIADIAYRLENRNINEFDAIPCGDVREIGHVSGGKGVVFDDVEYARTLLRDVPA